MRICLLSYSDIENYVREVIRGISEVNDQSKQTC